MPRVDMVQQRWAVTTQVRIMTDKLRCLAVFNKGLCRTLVTNRIEALGAPGGHDKHPNSLQYRGRGARISGRHTSP